MRWLIWYWKRKWCKHTEIETVRYITGDTFNVDVVIVRTCKKCGIQEMEVDV